MSKTSIPSKSSVNARYLTTEELADLLRTNPATVRYWRHIGDGPLGFKVGRRVLYDVMDVDAWLAARRADALIQR